MRGLEHLEPRRLLAFTTPIISEFLATNTNGLEDAAGDKEDWIEIHNPTSSSKSLNGYFLTDDPANKRKWAIPNISLPARGYTVIFASGENKRTLGQPLHTNFQLDGGGEYLALVAPNGTTVLSQFSPFPRQNPDVSYGLPVANTNTVGDGYRLLRTPTPGAPNNSRWIVGDTNFSKDRGFYTSSFTVSLSTQTFGGAQIRYTLDGTPPTATTGTVYTTPITINKTSTLRAAAYKSGWLPSNVDTQTYIFLNDVIRQSPDGSPPAGWPDSWGNGVDTDYGMDPDIVDSPTYSGRMKSALTSIPTISMVTDLDNLFDPATGIYANSVQDGRDWERPTSVELIKPDGTKGFQIDAGVRIRGGFSRGGNNPKHGFRLFFRGEYGDKQLDYPIFGANGAKTHDSFDLRTFQNYSWAFQGSSQGIFVRDQFNRDTQLAMGQQGERGDFYHLYINGQYFGLYNTAERPEANWASDYYGGKPEDYDVVKVDPDLGYSVEATDGNLNAWNELWNLARAGLGSEAAYQRIQGNNPNGTRNTSYKVLLDVDNLIDYMLVSIYAGNLDGPVSWFLGNQSPNNFFAVRSRAANSTGFKFIHHDSEHTLLNVNEDRSGPFPAGTQSASKMSGQYLWQQLLANPSFRLRAADHVEKHMVQSGGALTPSAVRARFLARKNEIDRAVIAESARWGDSKREPPLTRDNEWIAEINRILNQYIPQRTAIVLAQLRADGVRSDLSAPVFSRNGGTVERGFQLTMSNPNGRGSIYYTIDGSDPRLSTGGLNPNAIRYTGAITLTANRTFKARVMNGTTWSGLTSATFTVVAPTTGSVAGVVWRDTDGDGVKDSGESGFSGVRVFIDADNDGIFDSTEKNVLTDSGGNYKFTGLLPATYRIRRLIPSGWRSSAPSAGYHSVTIQVGVNTTGKNFGLTQTTLVSGSVFNDANSNALRDSGESGLSGWRVYVDANRNGVLDAGERSVLTNSNGDWSFNALAAGTYQIRIVQQSGWMRTTPTLGYHTVTVTAGGSVTNRRFGQRRA